MLTKLIIKNFKKLNDTSEIELGGQVVFIGPNNSGKTTALQALSLWYIGLSKWLEKKVGKTKEIQRTGAPINRKDIFSIPTPDAKYLWNNLKVRSGSKTKAKGTENIRIEIIVEGTNEDKMWKCGLEFDYSGQEVIYCRPIKSDDNLINQYEELFKTVKIAYLPPMSGLVSEEPKLLNETIAVRIGEGRTADVLRNICYQVVHPEIINDEYQKNKNPFEVVGISSNSWSYLVNKMSVFFGVILNEPFLNARGEIVITYKDEHNIELDISCAGRGLQQVLLLLSYLMANPKSVLLLDEPDAHLEILRQRQIYTLITNVAKEKGSQIIAASHSEIILNEAVDKDTVIAFIGKRPHRLNDKGSQLLKSLKTIGFQDYYQAEIKKWVLYLEGSTDLAILQQFATILDHPAKKYLENPFFHSVSTNLPNDAREHFYGLKEAVKDLKGVAIFDRLDNKELPIEELKITMWKSREIENYFFNLNTLLKYAKGETGNDLFSASESSKRVEIIKKCFNKIVPPIAQEDLDYEYWQNCKASEQLEQIFKIYFQELGIYNSMPKNQFYLLSQYLNPSEKDKKEIIQKLDLIVEVASSAEIIN